MIKLGSFCDLQSSASASHTAESPLNRGEGKRKKRKKNNSRFCSFFLYVWWQPTKELRKSLIIYFARQCGDCLSTIDLQLTAVSRDSSKGNSSSQTCTHASPGKQRLLLLKLYFFNPNKKKVFLLSQFPSHTETRFSFSYFVQSSAVIGTDNVALQTLRVKFFKKNIFCRLLIKFLCSIAPDFVVRDFFI